MAFIRKLSIPRIPRWVTPTFFIVMTLLIVIFNDALGDEDAFVIFGLFYFMILTIVLIRWLVLQIKSIIKLKKEKKQAELLHLKSQVNPHFFFNTLNNLYGLVEEDPKQAQQLILNLSDMMRYSIYEGQNDWVTLNEEIAYLKNYIDLHKMRYHKKIEIRFKEEVIDRNQKIMPLLFIILLENAFKHGVENLRNHAYVAIQLRSTSSSINFEIENNFDPEEVNKTAGIGLENLKKRLELVYPEKHQLKFAKGDSLYKAQLILKV